MNQAQKRALAMEVIHQVANLAEFWDEYADRNPDLEGIDRSEAAQTMANWLGRLPGDRWDLRLPQPTYPT